LLLALLFVLGGCSSVAKKQYLKHITTTMSPVSPDVEPVGDRGSAVAAADGRDRR
jgi:hypothetical protein